MQISNKDQTTSTLLNDGTTCISEFTDINIILKASLIQNAISTITPQ